MGNAQVMTAKVAWDNACYWAITALLFFQRRLRQPEFMASIDPLMRRFFVLHARMQQFLRAWYRRRRRHRLRDSRRRTSSTSTSCAQLQASLGDPIDGRRAAAARGSSATSRCSKRSRARWQAIALERHAGLRRIVDADAGPQLDVGCLKLTPVGVPVA